jgi:rubrerythrin
MYVVEVLERCAELAARVARLYRQLAERFPQDPTRERLWRELALLEETHAEVLRQELRAFRERDETGDFLPEMASRLEQAAATVAAIEEKLRAAESVDSATEAAVALEQMRLEELYDDLFIQGEPAFRVMAERMEGALAEHPDLSVEVLRRPWSSNRGS